MFYRRIVCAAFSLAVMTAPCAVAQAPNPQYEEQESWQQFEDKEMTGAFKGQRPKHKLPAPPPALVPAAQATSQQQPQQQEPQPAPQQFTTYMPPPAPDYGRNVLQTDYVPVMRPSFFPFAFFTPAANRLSVRPITRVIQTGPAKPSGNYYQPATPDSTASGNYYADRGNAPKVAPVYQPDPQPADYWGKPGSPLPPDMQPQ